MAKAVKKRTTRRLLPAEHRALIEQICSLSGEHKLAVDKELALEEDTSAWRRARKAADAANHRLVLLTRRILARPIVSWADVAVLAELSKAHDSDIGKITDMGSGEVFYRDLPQEVLSAVLDGILQLAGRSSARGFVCGDAARIYPPSALAAA